MNAFSLSTKRHVLNALLAAPLLFSCAYASAEDAAPAVEAAAPAAAAPAEAAPPYTLTFNLGLYSYYMFRGVDTADGPALQGGVDFAHSSGLFAGTWWSNIDSNWTGHGDGFSDGNHLETDWYAGYAHTFDNGFGVSLMGNYYFYPDGENSYSYNAGTTGFSDGSKQDTLETSIALSYKWLTYTLYYIPTDYYGAAASGTKDGTDDTSGATYNELKFNYTLPVADLNLLARVGYQHTPNLAGSQADYQIGISKNFSLPGAGKPIEGFNAGAYYTGTFDVENEAFYLDGPGTRDTNKDRLTFYVKRTW
jgi:uncharacterized protein (TIGR02001 family)